MARPIITLLFPSLVDYREVAISLLQYGSVACVFYSVATMTTSVLQGNNRMRIPVVNSFISFVLHVIIVYPLLRFTDLSVYVLLIGDVTFQLVITLLNLLSLKVKTGYSQEIKRTFLLPAVISAVMGAVAWGIYKVTAGFGIHSAISLAAAVICAVAVYGSLTLIMGVFSDDEILDLPMGGRILRLSKRIRKNSR